MKNMFLFSCACAYAYFINVVLQVLCLSSYKCEPGLSDRSRHSLVLAALHGHMQKRRQLAFVNVAVWESHWNFDTARQNIQTRNMLSLEWMLCNSDIICTEEGTVYRESKLWASRNTQSCPRKSNGVYRIKATLLSHNRVPRAARFPKLSTRLSPNIMICHCQINFYSRPGSWIND